MMRWNNKNEFGAIYKPRQYTVFFFLRPIWKKCGNNSNNRKKKKSNNLQYFSEIQ